MTAAPEPREQLGVRDTYRFGDGPALRLIPGTVGWTASDLDQPEIRYLWDDGCFEIIDGVLAVMPPAYFAGGECASNLTFRFARLSFEPFDTKSLLSTS